MLTKIIKIFKKPNSTITSTEKVADINFQISTSQNEKNISQTTTIIDYLNGGQYKSINGNCVYIKYNTGDQIWFELKDGSYQVSKIDTWDRMAF